MVTLEAATAPRSAPEKFYHYSEGRLDQVQGRQRRQGVLHVHAQGHGGLPLPRRGPGALHGDLGSLESTKISARESCQSRLQHLDGLYSAVA